MRKLVWFSLGFGAACCLCAYVITGSTRVILAAAVGFLTLFAAIAGRKFALFRRIAAVLLGFAMGVGWFILYDGFYLNAAGTPRERTYVVGSPMAEVLHDNLEQIKASDVLERLGLEKGKYILGMCRFVPEKNLHHLVEAYRQLIVKNEKLIEQGYKLVLAGDTDFEDEYSLGLKQMARENGVVLTGFIKGRKLHSLLTNCCCYCLPSSHEGLPIALLEAMSYGVKVVVSDIHANLEVGLPKDDYFHCGNVDELSEKLGKIIEAPLQHVDYDMSKYDWDQIADEVGGVYQGLKK